MHVAIMENVANVVWSWCGCFGGRIIPLECPPSSSARTTVVRAPSLAWTVRGCTAHTSVTGQHYSMSQHSRRLSSTATCKSRKNWDFKYKKKK